MGEIVAFPGPPPTRADRVLVAVEDELFGFLSTTSFTTEGQLVEYVPAGALEHPDTEADIWLGRYAPSAPGRRLFFQTLSGAVYECDDAGLVWRGGELVWTEPLADFGVAGTSERGIIQTGRSAALLFMEPVDDGWHVRVRVTTPVLLVAHAPTLGGAVPVPRGWLSLAQDRPGR